jgi:hypothetical protein
MYGTLEYDAAALLGHDRDQPLDGLDGFVRLTPPRDGTTAALATIREGLDELAAADPDELTDDELAAALEAVVEAGSRLAGQEARLIDRFDRREIHRRDACVTTTSWLRWRTRLGYGDAQRRAKRARVLRDMPRLHDALVSGNTTPTHVDMVARRAIPMRRAAIAEHDATLAQLARDADPGAMGTAVRHIVAHLDQAGGDPQPECHREDLRELRLRNKISEEEHQLLVWITMPRARPGVPAYKPPTETLTSSLPTLTLASCPATLTLASAANRDPVVNKNGRTNRHAKTRRFMLHLRKHSCYRIENPGRSPQSKPACACPVSKP